MFKKPLLSAFFLSTLLVSTPLFCAPGDPDEDSLGSSSLQTPPHASSSMLVDHSPSAPSQDWEELTMAWFAPGSGSRDERTEIRRQVLQSMNETARDSNHPDQVKALNFLSTVKENTRLFYASGNQLSHRALSEPDHKTIDSWDGFMMAWSSPGNSRAEKAECRRQLLPLANEIAGDSKHPDQFRALTFLWEATPETHREARPFLLNIARDPEHPNHMCALTLLWNSDGAHSADHRWMLAPYLLNIAQDSHSPHRLDAATKLWKSKVGQEKRYRDVVRFILPDIFFDTEQPERQQRDAVSCFRHNKTRLDHLLAERLHEAAEQRLPQSSSSRQRLAFN